jgi:hypothetical protein
MSRFLNRVSKLRLKVTALWDVAPYNFVELDRRFRGAYCLHYQAEESRYISEALIFLLATMRT